MKAYRLTVMVIDLEEIGEDQIRSEIENARYANRCISPDVVESQGQDIGEWSDDHPLNRRDTSAAEWERLFPTPGA